MPGDGVPLLVLLLCLHAVCGASQSQSCLPDPASAYRYTGAVCRLTYPAAAVLNEKTTKVIEAAFQHARYPRITGEKSILFIGTVKYGLDNLEIHNLSIGESVFELRPPDGIGMKISNVMNVAHSIDFEVESQIDLGINPRLYCGKGKVAADTSDCFLDFHKLSLQLQGDKEPNLLKRLFTDIITFTVKLLVKGQGLTKYNNISAVINESAFHPSQLTEHRMLYFWISDQVLNPIIAAAHLDGRFHLNVSGMEIITSPRGTSVQTQVSGELHCGSSTNSTLSFEMPLDKVQQEYLREAVEKIGIPKILSVLQPELTRLLDKQGTNLFDIVNPEVLPQNVSGK
ncbi:hypothetical protein NHX12_003023 [Muraenolepis orangiensis]|uniref:Lipid-binding serum glycoprotein N-terminal domain-containing protein n=1 Tax=Muraenolepis orangiensis TaxID=630683 RepID=A0A9Q0IF99_9TELE|nr:hypothetical protein NHX12_003023 [Muraenolepis orangiensis]